MKPKIAIACQGGGSQTAFTAGALKALCEANLQDTFDVVSISGTSGGAICATLVWFALERGENSLSKRLMDFWKDNTAYGWLEHAFNHFIVDSIRMANRGMFPTWQLSPYSPLVQTATALT